MNDSIVIEPQEGPQTRFLQSKADIAIYGGAAGGGKSFALLLEPLYQYDNEKFGAVIFRRNTTQVRNLGGLWDESLALYSRINGSHSREAILEWEFASGMTVKFSHLENEKTVFDWQGSQIPLIGFDELTHFTEKQFWYMLSRNRSVSGVPGRIRATTNPDKDSWVRKLIDWWVGEDGFPIKDRSGVLRWFIRIDDKIIWADTAEELRTKYGTKQRPKSLTFISAKLKDNKILMTKDPAYEANIMALPKVERMRLGEGNWNIKAAAGTVFKREWFEIIDALPANPISVCRYWDKAATIPHPENPDPDWTRGVKLYKYANGTWVVGDMRSDRNTPLNIENLIKNTATQDTTSTPIYIEQEPGSSGVADVSNYTRLLQGFDVRARKPTKDKVTRAGPVSAQSEARNIKLLRGSWNDDFLNELENFPEDTHDDIVDALSGAFNEMCGGTSILDVFMRYK